MTLDLTRTVAVVPLLQPDDHHRARVRTAIGELANFIRETGRNPVFADDGRIPENVLALRLHAYVCILANLDDVPSPPNPLTTAPKRLRPRRQIQPPMPMFDELDQTRWAEGWQS